MHCDALRDSGVPTEGIPRPPDFILRASPPTGLIRKLWPYLAHLCPVCVVLCVVSEAWFQFWCKLMAKRGLLYRQIHWQQLRPGCDGMHGYGVLEGLQMTEEELEEAAHRR